uniref:Urotensin-2 receptor-like n=1 Tax=Petromyzon marinus TaxID=7757 RepID=A0AAJ7XET8_PETMA|nr:urotensin-2 receptor-like [Petromyzon marinus]
MSSAGNRSAESGGDHHHHHRSNSSSSSNSSHHLLLQGQQQQQQLLALQQQLLLLALPSANSSSAHDFPATAASMNGIHGHHNRSHLHHHHHQQEGDYDEADSRSAMAIAVVLSAMFVVGVAGNVYTLTLVLRHALAPPRCWGRLLRLLAARAPPPPPPQQQQHHYHHQHLHNHHHHQQQHHPPLYTSMIPSQQQQQQQPPPTTPSLRRRSASSTSSMHVYVLNLALADLLYVATAPFVACSNVARTWHFGDAGCRLLLSADLLTTHASAFILTAMSVERYAAVHRPLRSLERGLNARRLVALAAWLGALALALPGTVMVRMEEVAVAVSSTRSVTKRVCEPTWSEEAHRVYMSALFAAGILAPGVIIGCVYAKLARTYWLSQTAMGGFGRCKVGGRGRSPHSPRHKVLYLILAIVIAFWACFLPFWLWQLLQLYRPHVALASVRTARAVNHAVTCLTYGNSCVNPFLYTLLTNKYKEYLATGARLRLRRAETSPSLGGRRAETSPLGVGGRGGGGSGKEETDLAVDEDEF